MSTDIHPSKYPQARRDELVFDDFHGTKVADPYRWMEDPDSKETKDFVTELNNVSEPFIKESGVFEKLQSKITKLWDYEKYGGVSRHGNSYYVFYNSGLQNQSVLYQNSSYKEKGKVFFDINKLSSDGTTAISSYSWTEDGTLMAVSLSEKGSDMTYAQFLNNKGETLPDKIPNIKFGSIDWLPNNEGVVYSTYPGLRTCTEKSLIREELNHSVYYHKMGSDSKDDILIAEFPDLPKHSASACITEDGNFLTVETSESCGIVNHLHYYDLRAVGHKISGPIQLKTLFNDDKFRYNFVTNIGQDEALILTNRDAPMTKLIKIKFADPSKSVDVLKHDDRRYLEYVVPFARDKLMALYLEDVHHVLQINDLHTGELIEKVPLPIGTLSSLHARQSRTEVFFAFESFLNPPTVYRFDYSETHQPNKIPLEVVYQPSIKGFNPSDFETKQVFYQSKDGTRVPMFITAKKGVEMNAQNPTILYGYGGFTVSVKPSFSISRTNWLNSGGVYALANIRGGEEYGEKWHEAGMLGNKQNVFDDFHYAAKYLIETRYTSPEKLAIEGGSNGGLLVAACAQQRPDLYGAIIGRVGVLDMLRYHKFTIGHAWMPEYGDPGKAEHFEFLYKYSPLHNIRIDPKHQWPSTLMLTADHDDRVVPAHTLKYMAQLYHVIYRDAADRQRKPLLAAINVDAGHGSGKPTSKIIEELAKIYAFLHRVLKIEYRD